MSSTEQDIHTPNQTSIYKPTYPPRLQDKQSPIQRVIHAITNLVIHPTNQPPTHPASQRHPPSQPSQPHKQSKGCKAEGREGMRAVFLVAGNAHEGISRQEKVMRGARRVTRAADKRRRGTRQGKGRPGRSGRERYNQVM